MIFFILGISLFEDLPQNRSCADALIPLAYCRCHKGITIDIKQFRKDIQRKTSKNFNESLIDSLNNFTELLRDQCEVFKLEKVISARQGYYLGDYYEVSIEIIKQFEISSNYNNFKPTKVIFKAQPGNAVFKAIVRPKNDMIDINGFKRLSKYGSQSECMNDKIYSGICFCKPVVKKNIITLVH